MCDCGIYCQDIGGGRCRYEGGSKSMKRKMRLVSQASVPTAKRLISLIARGEHTYDQIVEACRLWVTLQQAGDRNSSLSRFE